ncbi:MAG: 16S rRNA (guanine(966)-N(2))-methyltransferase RsmD [Actinomycetota bacterium]|nr:16S rRNA (guanine(966)-N(2))-methyltransferase RsmD [Actinomycetota bacterium]
MLRVVAGRHGGRRLKTPPGRDTRPTADRVREALFSILGPISETARVLDLFAGSGALGIEALSRGAAAATFVERDRRAAEVVRENLRAIEAEQEVVVADALRWLGERAGEAAYDLVFLDPPYDSARRLARPLSERLPGVLAAGALIVTESDKRTPLMLDLPLETERTYGDTRIAIHHGA